MQQSISENRFTLQSFNNSGLLKKALDKGEINLIDYVLELSNYYDTQNQLFDLERDLNKAVAELYQFM